MDKQIRNLTGDRFGAWVVLSYVEEKKPPHWACRCDCGTERVVSGHNLKKGTSTNCGCLRQHRTTHGHAARDGKTRTYRQWKGMHSRCRPDSYDRRNYAERGISVVSEWSEYSRFLADMGECPDGLTLDRIDNDQGYGPGNCRWADYSVQRHNQRRVTWVDYAGERVTVQEAAFRIGVHPSAIWNDKRRNGVSAQEAVDRVASRQR